MTKRALLIGSPVDGLAGCDTDLGSMKEALQGHGFEDIDERRDQGAVRDGIREGYRALIEASDEGDVALVYYSGHGATARNPQAGKPGGGPLLYRCIVPFDYHQSTEGDFRGITDLELSMLLAELTAKTANVTVILDCCHAARMSRDIRARRPRALRDPLEIGVAKHFEGLLADRARLARVDVESNPLAVRLVACGPDDSAWEYAIAPDRIGGVFTEAVARALRDPGASGATWESIGRSVRDRVTGIFPYQRPDVEGPARRFLFSVKAAEKDGRLGVSARPGGAVLRGGRLLDVRVGDVYDIHPSSTADQPIAGGVVQSVGLAESVLTVQPVVDIPEGAYAILAVRTAHRFPIAVRAAGAERAALARAVEESPLVRLASQEEPPLATLAVDAGRLAILDFAGDRLAEARHLAEAVQTLPTNLRSIAMAQSLRELRDLGEPTFKESDFAVTWGVVEDGEMHDRPLSGERVRSGASFFVRFENKGSKTLYFNVFDVGLSQKVDRLSDSAPGGLEVKSGDPPSLLGVDASGKAGGWELVWPRSVPVERARHPLDPAREESFVIIIADQPHDLSPLEAPAVRGGLEPARRSLTELESRFAQLFQGTTHATRTAKVIAPTGGCRVVRIDFYLEPPPA